MAILTYAIFRYRIMDIRLAVTRAGIFLVVYAIALGLPFYFYKIGQHFPALVTAVILASAAPFIYARLRQEVEELFWKDRLAYQEALTRSVQDQLIESEKMATIGFLVGGLAHQLKNRFTPLVFHAGFASKVLEKNRDAHLSKEDCDQALDYLKKVTESVHSSKEVINGVLNYACDRETMGSVPVNKLVASTIDLIQFKIEEGSIVFDNSITDDALAVKGNFAQLQEVVFNIIDNACHAMMEKLAAAVEPGYKPRISFTAVRQGDMVVIVVADNGMGVKEENMRKLFKPLFSTKKESRKGHGLGLYMMRQIVEKNHNGRVELSSVYTRGTTLTLRLPVDVV